MHKHLLPLSIMSFFVVGILLTIVVQPKAQEQKNDATVIQIGVMSDRQKEHSKLFRGYGTGTKLIDAAKQHGSVNRVRGRGDVSDDPFAFKLLKYEQLTQITCEVDAVVLGTVVQKESQLTSDGEFVFTEYEVKIGEVAKNDESKRLSEQKTITVVRPGGAVRVQNYLITAEDGDAPSLAVDGTYLFFLKAIQKTGAYVGTERTSLVLMNERKVTSLIPTNPMPLSHGDLSLAIEEIRNASNRCREGRKQ